MSKKSFKTENPAMQFISAVEQYTDNTDNANNKQYTHNTDIADNKQYADNKQNLSKKVKVLEKSANKVEIEKKTRRINLILQPSILENITKIATMKQTSVNDLVNTVLGEYSKKEANIIEKYDSVFK